MRDRRRNMTMKRKRISLALTILLLVLLAGGLVWATDRITLQGERTLYAVQCERGQWDGARCTGVLVPGERYAFRASARRGEVLYWIRGSAAPSGKFAECNVKDRDNWACRAQPDQPPPVIHEMVNGRPTLTVPFHYVSKWKWWALRLGVGAFTEANG